MMMVMHARTHIYIYIYIYIYINAHADIHITRIPPDFTEIRLSVSACNHFLKGIIATYGSGDSVVLILNENSDKY